VGGGESDLDILLRDLRPELRDGRYVFTSVERVPVDATPIVTVREDEGVTLVVEVAEAERLGIAFASRDVMAMITLRVHSSLAAVGLTAAVSAALTARSISCNVVAGFHHDHLFVPADRATDALAALTDLSSSHQPGRRG
jgi:uncharacterized protein